MQTRPFGDTAKASSAWTSLSPPRLTNFCRAVTRRSAPGATKAPGLSTRLPSTVTAPARSSRAAFSRLSHRPRATSATSMRSLTFACPAGTRFFDSRATEGLGFFIVAFFTQAPFSSL